MSEGTDRELAERLTGLSVVLTAWQAAHERALEVQGERYERLCKEVQALRLELQSWQLAHELKVAELSDQLRALEAELADQGSG